MVSELPNRYQITVISLTKLKKENIDLLYHNNLFVTGATFFLPVPRIDPTALEHLNN